MLDSRYVGSQSIRQLYSYYIIYLDGTAFHIKDPQVLAEKYLPKYFRHGKFSSLIRQLNFYSFYKVQEGSSVIYQHSYFRKGRIDLLSKIKRRGSGKAKDPFVDPLSQSSTAIEPLMSPLSRPVSMESMSPLHKPSLNALAMPPAVSLGAAAAGVAGMKRTLSKTSLSGKELPPSKRVSTTTTTTASPPLDIAAFFTDDCKIGADFMSLNEPEKPLLLSRDCLKWPGEEENKKKELIEFEFSEAADDTTLWERPLSPLNLPDQSAWLDLAF